MHQIGYNYFEVSIDNLRVDRLDWSAAKIHELRDCAHQNDIRIFSMNLSAHRHFPLGSSKPEISTKAVDILKKAVDFSYEAGIRVVQLAGYDVFTEEKSTQRTKERFIHNLSQGVTYAAQAGVMLAIEPVDLAFITSCEHAMEYVALLASPWLKVYTDMANVTAAGHDAAADLLYAQGHIVAIHVKDGLKNVIRNVPFGQGIVPFVTVFKQLNAMGFQGPYIVEMWGEDDPDYAQSIHYALEFTKKCIEQGRDG